MCRKKMEPMKESERTRTIKGSLWKHENISKSPSFSDVNEKNVHSETRWIIRVEFEHCVWWPARASCTRWVWSWWHLWISCTTSTATTGFNLLVCVQTKYMIYTHRIWLAPGGLATAPAAERLPAERGESESDYQEFVSLPQVPACTEILLTIGVANEGAFSLLRMWRVTVRFFLSTRLCDISHLLPVVLNMIDAWSLKFSFSVFIAPSHMDIRLAKTLGWTHPESRSYCLKCTDKLSRGVLPLESLE